MLSKEAIRQNSEGIEGVFVLTGNYVQFSPISIKYYAEDYVNDGDDVVKAADAAADRMTAIFTQLIERL